MVGVVIADPPLHYQKVNPKCLYRCIFVRKKADSAVYPAEKKAQKREDLKLEKNKTNKNVLPTC